MASSLWKILRSPALQAHALIHANTAISAIGRGGRGRGNGPGSPPLGARLRQQARTTPIDWQGLATTRNSLAASIGAISAGVVVAQVLIRQLDDRVVAILREQARARGVSLEQSLREMLTQAAQQHSDVRQRLAALRRQTPARAQDLDVAALIREGREQR